MRLLTMKTVLFVVPFTEAASVMGHESLVISFSNPTNDP